MTDPKALIVLPRLQVQSANAASGPLTWGFPSPTAFSGFAHALERRLANSLEEGFGGVGIVCHKFEPQVTQPAGKYTRVFNLARHPVGKDGKTAAIVEEGRAHMEVSLVIGLSDHMDEEDREAFLNELNHNVYLQRLAGGTLLPRIDRRYQPQYWSLPIDRQSQDALFMKLRRRLLPGFALVQREDKLQQRLAWLRQTDAESNALDALLDLSRLNIEPDIPDPDNPDEKQWGIRKNPGWLVPIPVGYASISPLYQPGEVRNARDNDTPCCFVENLYSLGEWVSPHRLTTLEQLLWHQQADVEKGIYQCSNHYADFVTNTDINNK